MTLNLASIFQYALQLNADRILNRNCVLPSYKHKEFLGEVATHFSDISFNDTARISMITTGIIGRTNFIEKVLGDEEIRNSNFIDLGDSDGLFLEILGKRQTSLNVSDEALKTINAKGMKTVRANIDEGLPFPDNSFDYVLLLNTLEHLLDPVGSLKEIYRICKKSLIVTTPYVAKTIMYGQDDKASCYMFQNRLFEFSDSDFRKLVSHTGFDIKEHEIVECLNSGRTPLELLVSTYWKLFVHRDMIEWCFRKFSMYHLAKEA